MKIETIVQIFRMIIQLCTVIILKSTNEYYQKISQKSGRKMDLYLAMEYFTFPGSIGVLTQVSKEKYAAGVSPAVQLDRATQTSWHSTVVVLGGRTEINKK